MNNVNKYLNTDYFKFGRADNITLVRNINIAVFAVMIIVGLNIIFFLTVYSTTYYAHLDEIEDIIKEYKQNGQKRFDNMHVGLKIMPSYNTEKNIIFMDKVNDYKRTRIKEALGLMGSYDMNYSYFFVNKTSYVFPKLDYKQEAIPVGNSITMCFNLAWAEASKGNHFDLMKEIKNFPECNYAKSGKFIWNDDDSKVGMDIPIWIQKEYDIDCANDNECDYYCEKYYNAEFVSGKRGKKCYSYEVLSAICLAIEFNPLTNEWSYVGGCFKDNKNYLLEPAVINQIYDFSGVEIEIRNKNDPIIQAGLMSNYTYKFGTNISILASLMKYLFYLSIIASIGIIVVIIIERNKKPSNLLIQDNQPQSQKNDVTKNDSNLAGNNKTQNLNDPSSSRGFP